MSLKLSNIKNVRMITWKFLMETQRSHQSLADYVAARYQIPSWLPGIRCLFGLFLMPLFKEKAFRPPIPQVSSLPSCFSSEKICF